MSRQHRGVFGPMMGIVCDGCGATVPYVAEDAFPKGWEIHWGLPHYVDVCPECLKDWPPDVSTGDGYA